MIATDPAGWVRKDNFQVTLESGVEFITVFDLTPKLAERFVQGKYPGKKIEWLDFELNEDVELLRK